MMECTGMEDTREKMEWWKKVIVYQIYPRSFQDSTGNGIGDIPGIISRLDYLQDLGVGAIWLSPFYPSPQFDFGYDISDFCNVDPTYGTLADFDKLVKEAHERGLKIITDFVPGHTSHLHDWFQRSVRRENPYTDYYVWHDGVVGDDGRRKPPNNWLSVFGGAAWTWNEQRQQYYYRPFLPEQPKLNFRCQAVREEMRNVLRFWFERGVDGIRADAIEMIMEEEDKSLDEPVVKVAKVENCKPDQFEYLDHTHTSMHPDGFPLIQEWSDVLSEFEKRDGQSRFMVIEIYHESRNEYRKYGGIPFNMDLIDTLEQMGFSGGNVKRLIEKEYDGLKDGEWPTFVIGNHDRHRVSTTYGQQFADSLNILLLTLRGTPTTYYGEELAMENISVSYEDTQDPFGKNMGPERYLMFSRDPCRSPMQWRSETQAGFSSNKKTWLPVHPQFADRNVETFSEENGETNPLKVYKACARLRQETPFVCGTFQFALCNEDIVSYVRQHSDCPQKYLIALNLGKKSFTGDFSKGCVGRAVGEVLISSSRAGPALSSGQKVKLDQLTLNSGDGVVIKIEA